MRLKTIGALAVLALTLGIGVQQALALEIEIETGQGNKTVLDPFAANGNAEQGDNPAHGPSCGLFESCANNGVTGVNPGVTPTGLEDRTYADLNLGAWNGFFLSNESSAICGISAVDSGGTVDEAPCP